MKPAQLYLEDQQRFDGFSPNWVKGDFPGEVIFTTGMTGYPETLTDPSYTGQIIVFTYPLIGNYGIPKEEEWESKKIHAHGVIVSEVCQNWSHHSGLHSLVDWLEAQNVPILTGVDTRALTKRLRKEGTMLGAITTGKEKIKLLSDPNQEHLVKRASIHEPEEFSNGKKIVYAIDCGMKENILRSLKQYPITVKRVPFDYDFTDEEFDGVFISNGPGDPTQCPETIEILKKAMKKGKPMFGICLGNQLMALAAGAKTYKLTFGHRGQNQPCLHIEKNQCYLTSQNHGYAVDKTSLPSSWKVTFQNINDGSVEGIAHKTKPFFAVQFHPEATPGPTDTHWLFDQFTKML